jgi:hypothetical protein
MDGGEKARAKMGLVPTSTKTDEAIRREITIQIRNDLLLLGKSHQRRVNSSRIFAYPKENTLAKIVLNTSKLHS